MIIFVPQRNWLFVSNLSETLNPLCGLLQRQQVEEDIELETVFGGRWDMKRRRMESDIIRAEMHGRLVD